jgi:hypothetical protein
MEWRDVKECLWLIAIVNRTAGQKSSRLIVKVEFAIL